MERSQFAFLALRYYHYCEDYHFEFPRVVRKRAIEAVARGGGRNASLAHTAVDHLFNDNGLETPKKDARAHQVGESMFKTKE